LLRHVEADPARDGPAEPVEIGEDLESDDTHAFLCAFDLCFPPEERTVEDWADVVDKVLLPFWRQRWRLFEVWAILWLRNAIPEELRPRPCLVPRPDAASSYAWVLSGGKAADPVAVNVSEDRTLSLWFQRETPLAAEDAATFGQDHVEPDVRLCELIGDGERDLAILELKDRYEAGGSEEKRVARMYATTGAPVVCVANYSPFGSRSLRGALYVEETDGTTIFLADEFRPGSTPSEVADAIRRAVTPPLALDFLLDVSSSMEGHRMEHAFGALPVDLRVQAGWFRWADTFEAAIGEPDPTWSYDGPAADLGQALRAYEALDRGRRAVVLTDADGARQFDALDEENRSRYICIDVTAGFDVEAILRWCRSGG
jgi:hypothetical protein